MRLRLQHSKGSTILNDATPEMSLLDLRKVIGAQLGHSDYQSIQVKAGYPPKTLSNDSESLNSLGVKSGEVLRIIVESGETDFKESVKEAPKAPSLGSMVLRPMEDDNSCLFRSIGIYVMTKNKDDTDYLRSVAASCIECDPDTYSDAILGMKREDYIATIKKKNSWGGAIELLIFSAHFGVEIDSIDVQTGRVDKFGEGMYRERVFILYSGIHYDALACPSPGGDKTRFLVSDDKVLEQATILAAEQKRQRKYTDVANFTLRCATCRAGLVGEKDAQKHAKETGHTSFEEYQ